MSDWPLRLWNFDKHYQYIGGSGGVGVGYGAPAAVGAALANRKHGRFSVSIQNDGDLLYAPGVLWTAAHHRIPLLIVMHNNRAYHQEVMHVQRMANRHKRGIDRATSARRSRIRRSISRRSRRAWECMPKGRSRIRRILAPALRARHRRSSSAASRRSRHHHAAALVAGWYAAGLLEERRT